jgi:molecular chaperone DnaK
VLVYDLGGGTFDVSIIDMSEGVADVRATAGDNFLGGDDFDEMLAALLADEFNDGHEIDLCSDHQAWTRLLRAAEEAKIALSGTAFASVNLEYIARDRAGKPLHIRREIEREEFEELIAEKIDETISLIDKALNDAELNAEG